MSPSRRSRSAKRSPTRPTPRQRRDSFACRGSSDDGVHRQPGDDSGRRSSPARPPRSRSAARRSPESIRRNPALNAFNHVVAERAIARADADRSAARGWRHARAAGRRARRAQGQPLRPRRADDRIVEDSRHLPSAVQRDRRREARSRLAPSSSARPTATSSRWDRRTRTRRTDRCAIRGHRSHARRIERWIGGRGRRAVRAARARIGHRRIDPAAGVVLRRRRAEADLRTRLALRAAGVRLVARSDRPVHANRRRRGARAVGVGRRTIRCDSTIVA